MKWGRPNKKEQKDRKLKLNVRVNQEEYIEFRNTCMQKDITLSDGLRCAMKLFGQKSE